MLIRGVRSRPMRLMATLRRMARLRAAVRSRTRLSSSRKVTSRTQWSHFLWSSAGGLPGSVPRVIAAAGQEIADLRFDLAGAVDTAAGFHRQHGAPPGPSAQRFQTGSLRADENTPADQPAMAVVEGIEDRPARGAAGEAVLLTTRLCRQKRLALIGLEDQQIIRVPVQDPASDRLLAAHGIQSDDAVLQGERLEQRWDRGDLVRLAIDLTLAEHQALLAGPGADQVQRPLRPAAVKGAAQGLAVNGHDLPVEDLGKGLSPGAEAGLEGVRVDQHEDAPEGVVRGNAVSQAQERPQPAQLVT